MANEILFWSKGPSETRWLSNFSEAPFMVGGKVYATVEHAFQAAKTLDPKEQERVRNAATPLEAKRLGRKVTLRRGWDGMKVDVMRELLRLKANQHPSIRQKLLATGDAVLREHNFWRGRQKNGRNVGDVLGSLWMELRAGLRQENEKRAKRAP